MEDISKELEKEFAQTRPKPFKRIKDTRVLIIDDFGLVKSGEYLKSIIRVLSVVSLVCLVGTILFFSLYIGVLGSSGNAKRDLKHAEKKIDALVQEKEILMARLVIEGKKPVLKNGDSDKKTMAPEVGPGLTEKWTTIGDSDQAGLEKEIKADIKDKAKSTTPDDKISKAANSGTSTDGVATSAIKENKTIRVEKFTVKKDPANGDLLVRFDIRNISNKPGDVSGRIFTILKPDIQNNRNWLVVPSSTLEKGIPTDPRKGQYFSIAHFKPMKFRVKTSVDPGNYTYATIYVFNDDGKMIADSQIDITETE